MIIHRRGHNFQSVGAISILNEVEECNKIHNSINKYLNILNIKHLDVTPGNMKSSEDLKYGVKLCNENNGDLFVSIHMNSSCDKVKKALGCEVWVYDDKNNKQAENVLKELEGLGFKNRGVKVNKNFYELKYTKCKAMIIEVCFVNSEEDCNLYKKVGYDEIGKVIAKAITGKEYIFNDVYDVILNSFTCKENALKCVDYLQSIGIPSTIKKRSLK